MGTVGFVILLVLFVVLVIRDIRASRRVDEVSSQLKDEVRKVESQARKRGHIVERRKEPRADDANRKGT